MSEKCKLPCVLLQNPSAASRRNFLKLLGASGAAIAAGAPYWNIRLASANTDAIIPADKQLPPEWIQSLFARGEKTIYRGAELEKIGMPVGGICTGQVYLGGDGRLWHWDIFNEFVDSGCSGPHYMSPMTPASPFEQGFSLRIAANGKNEVLSLDRNGFTDISFAGQYPIAEVEYRDARCPVAVSLEAFSPFIPLHAEDSHLPATVMRFTVRNSSSEKVEGELSGWIENAVCLYSSKADPVNRTNTVVRRDGLTALSCTAALPDGAENANRTPVEGRPDGGSMCLAMLDAQPSDLGSPSVSFEAIPQCVPEQEGAPTASVPTGEPIKRLVGALSRPFSLDPGAETTMTFVVTWYFPNIQHLNLQGIEGRRYGKRFGSADEVAAFVAANFDRLAGQTRLWRNTWYDSTLPYWFLDRTFLNISTLATSTAYWFGNHRFYGWEGVGSCPGTCTHVWQYAQAVGRIFPSLERTTREMVDYGLAFHDDTGAMDFRGEFDRSVAVDGQAGTILRAYREHQMSADDGFLKRMWPKIKKSLEFLIRQDLGEDGILDGPQHNTLDAAWFGQVAWLSSLYVAALLAGEQMAQEMGDAAFAEKTRTIAEAGTKNIDGNLFNGEFYIQVADKDHANEIGSYAGCEIDQVLGQSWAFQVGLRRVLPREHTLSALRSLWKYNFTRDIGPYRTANQPGRWYAVPGDGGLIMCTWPNGGREKPGGAGAWADCYFNECMSGFEYQVAAHMIWEGLVFEGLAITRAIHDRYHASQRNPWNEIECGDHYARAMASYGVFLAACGYEHHGPKGYLAFAPKLSPEDFRAAFTVSEGWGSFRQARTAEAQRATLEMKWGKLRLRSLAFELPANSNLTGVSITIQGKTVSADHVMENGRLCLTLSEDVVLEPGGVMDVYMDII